MIYAVYNHYASETSSGFLNTWCVVRFKNKAERAQFLADFETKRAKAVTRSEAEDIYAHNYESAGEKVPAGGLFERQRDFSGRLKREFRGIDYAELRAHSAA